MSPLWRRRIAESEGAALFVNRTMSATKDRWPAICYDLQQSLGANCAFDTGPHSRFEFALAVIGVELQALPNLLPPDQARRTRDLVYEFLILPGETGYPSAYATDTVGEYEREWRAAEAALTDPPASGPPNTPWDAVAAMLYDRLGFSAALELGGVEYKHPVVILALSGTIVSLCGWWKLLLSQYRLLPG